MPASPDPAAFAAAYDAGRPQVVWTELVADLETPVSAMLKIADGRANAFLLESVEGGAVRGRYSFIGIDPDLIWRCFGDRAEINREAATDAAAFRPCPVGAEAGALQSLRALVRETLIDLPPELPPMAAGLVGYLGYDVVRLVERLPDANPDVLGLPDALFVRPTVIAVFDNLADKVTMVTPVWPRPDLDAVAAYAAALARLTATAARLERTVAYPAAVSPPPGHTEPVSNISRDDYLALVTRAKEYIFAGDIFQVVPSQRFRAPFPADAFCLYRALRRLNPSPFLFFLRFDDFAVVGSSPEIMVRIRDGEVTIRPIAGTRPRGATAEEDRLLAADLLADPKELAEHLMLLDLGRNDVGRVARVGSVRVTEKMIIERYSHVMHIVSNVAGALDPRFDPLDAVFAGFPAGTVSGAPKVRAMEIIDELEPERRGIYGGCIGYLGADGEVDTCIALRTAVVKEGQVYVQAGGGVVADSDPAFEWQETVNKAKALLRAAEMAPMFASPQE
ncbi:MAG: anthranilate synthase component I [Rhodospirillales bacterium]